MSNVDVVRAMLDGYLTQDRAGVEKLVADDFRFTSPQDDHIDRAQYFERCFPTVERVRSQHLVSIVEAPDGGVFVMYEYELKDGGTFRNTEYITVQDGQVTEVLVFFGGGV